MPNPFEAVIADLLDCFIVKEFEIIPEGHLRLETRLAYPDGSNVDLYVHKDCAYEEVIRLSDMGQTSQWLQCAKPSTYAGAEINVALFGTSGIEQHGAAFVLLLDNRSQLQAGISKLAEACMHITEYYLNGSNT